MREKGREKTIRAYLLRITLNTMNRGTAPSARPLSLTEELEKLEQSITLTLQGPLYTPSKRSGTLMKT
jgi:hypothetical protein